MGVMHVVTLTGLASFLPSSQCVELLFGWVYVSISKDKALLTGVGRLDQSLPCCAQGSPVAPY